MRTSLSREWNILAERILIPGASAMLPTGAGASLLKFVSRHAPIMTAESDAAWHAARRWLEIIHRGDLDEASFKQRHRLYWLTDFADLFLSLSRSDVWLDRHLETVEAGFPHQGPILALTFHYGAGLWAMREFGRKGLNMAWLHAPVEATVPPGERLSSALGRMRIREVTRSTRVPAIPTGGSFQRMSDWIDSGGSVTALFDAPHFGQRKTMAIEALGQTLYLPDGLIRLAETKNLPVYLYTTSLCGDGPQRRLLVRGPFSPSHRNELIHEIGRFMHEEIVRDPAAWHCWRFLDGFTVPPKI